MSSSDEDDVDIAGQLTNERPLDEAGFSSDEDALIRQGVLAANRKTSLHKKAQGKQKPGAFQSMGLNPHLLKAIARKGYKVPTPIQRKTIPLILEGRDVVGMARTGSGKTAAFVLPLIERLKTHSAKVGVRAMVLSPSRELALQTLRVVKELGRGTDLKSVLLVGGDNLEDQFAMMAGNPDIVIATPGRFLHLKVEMSLDLRSMEYAVFDEADRLFEMGFADQLTEILASLPATRQTLLFSATLPKSLVEFARAGLQEPQLVRLDVDTKISTDLESAFFTVKPSEKEGALLCLLQHIIKLPRRSVTEEVKNTTNSKKPPRGTTSPSATLVFVATKHHVEYIASLLTRQRYAVSHVYGSLDQLARKSQIELFRTGQTDVLVVTDVAARGIDIPILSNVINYDFPSQPKVFVHRVGRTARAGKTGWSYSFTRPDEAGYLLDLQLFLGRTLVFAGDNYAADIVVGSLPRDGIEQGQEWVTNALAESSELASMKDVSERGEKLYLRTRTAASNESVKRGRQLVENGDWNVLHSLFASDTQEGGKERDTMLARVGGFRPNETVFEIGKRGQQSTAAEIMRRRRETFALRTVSLRNNEKEGVEDGAEKKSFQDEEYYLAHAAPYSSEKAYSVNNTLASASLDLMGDESTKAGRRWDSKKRKYVMRANDDDGSRAGKKMIRGESGVRIPASYKAGRFEAWKSAHKETVPEVASKRYKHNKVTAPKAADKARDDYYVRKKRVKDAREKGLLKSRAAPKDEIRGTDAVRKARQLKEKRRQKNARPTRKKKQ